MSEMVGDMGRTAAFVLGALLIPAGLATQLFLAGVAIFHDAAWWEVHGMAGGLLGVPILLLAVFSFTRWSPPSVRVPALIQAGLYLTQLALVGIGQGTGNGWIAALHPTNAFAMIAVATITVQRVREG